MANLHNFPVPLCSIAEQVYLSGLDKGYGSDDDSGLVRLWTSQPVASIQSAFSEEDKKAKLDLVSNLLIGIHLCAAAESMSFAKHVGIPLPQFYKLAIDAAGGSAMFKEIGPQMIDILQGKDETDSKILESYLAGLKGAVEEARNIKCPLYLGNGALNLLLQTGKNLNFSGLLGLYNVQ